MTTIALRGLWAHRRRMFSTVIAVILGVAFLAGTLLLTDTLRSNFRTLFAQADGQIDVVVRSAIKVGDAPSSTSRPTIDGTLVSNINGMPGVADTKPYIEGYGQLLGNDGKRIGGNGPPTRAANWVSDPSLNPYRLVAGHAPRAANEVVVNRGALKMGHLNLGQTTTLLTPQPVKVHIVGVATFGSADGFGPSTFTGLTLAAAQRHLTTGKPGQVSEILVHAASNTAPQQLADRIQKTLPAGVQAVTGAQIASESYDDVNSGFLGFLSSGLTAFAVIAVLVAAFSIYNTFSIVAAQRSRETALLRALGADRRQLIGAGALEALTVGAVGGLIGWAVGIGIAGGLKGVFDGFGFALPAGGLVFKASSAILAVGAGLLVTLVVGIAPAVRASHIPPVAAIRQMAAEPAGLSRRRTAIGAFVAAAGVTAVIVGAAASTFTITLLGAVALLIGTVLLGPATVRPAATLARLLPSRSATAQLSRENALRNPRRTAATAAALMLGVTVVTSFTVIGSSLKASAARGVDRTLLADVVVDQGGYGGVSGAGGLAPELAATVSQVPGVSAADGIGSGSVDIAGATKQVGVVNPQNIGRMLDLGVSSGALSDLRTGTIAVSSEVASKHGWRTGNVLPVTYPDGTRAHLRIVAIFDHPDLTGDYVLSRDGWTPHVGQAFYSRILIDVSPGADIGAVQRQVTELAAAYGAPRVQDQAQFRSSQTSGVNTILGLVYVMLLLAIVIAVMGIANTMGLAIHERSRELGLLRTLGQTRRQTRAMIRWESVIVALLGTVTGVCLGAFLGWALVAAASSSALAVFSLPVPQLLIVVVIGGFAGIVAAIRPARRATRLDVLSALATT